MRRSLYDICEGRDPRNVPIPNPYLSNNASSYRKISISKKLVSEPLVETSGGIAYYATESAHHPLYKRNFKVAPTKILLRTSAGHSIHRINTFLQRYGARLLPLDGYRPLALQRELREAYIQVIMRSDSISHDSAEIQADKFYSRAADAVLIDDPKTWHAHITGGACDFILTSLQGLPLEMGAMFDEMSELSQTNYFEDSDCRTQTAQAARANRRLLFWAMALNGWVNYPFEYFHFDFLIDDRFQTQFGIQNRTAWGIPVSNKIANVGPAPYIG